MNTKGLLDALLSAGQNMAQSGKDMATSTFSMPSGDAERKAMLGGMGKGALATGAIALLMGSKKSRNMGSKALQIGSVAALGGLAFKAYQSWQAQQNQTPNPQANEQLKNSLNFEQMQDSEIDARSKKLLQAMIAAAKSDGHIDAKEQEAIDSFIESLGESNALTQFIRAELEKPLDPVEIAQDTEAEGLAAEVYLMSRIIVDEENFMEKTYLAELGKQLALEPTLIEQLDKQVLNAAN